MTTLLDVKAALKEYWGYDEFLPLQERAIESVLSGRDSIVVLPTGGGKSICFQAPAASLPGLAIVLRRSAAPMMWNTQSLLQICT